MAKYTIELGNLLKNLILINKYSKASELVNIEKDYNELVKSPIEVVKNARTLFFNFDYKLYDETHKEELETKILYHYYNYEIGCETEDKFRFLINRKLNEILPYYNKIYYAMAKDYEFDVNVDLKEVIKNEGTTSATQVNTSALTSNDTDTTQHSYNDRLRASETPQGELEAVEDGKYLSKYDYNNGGEDTTKTNALTSSNNSNANNNGNFENKQRHTTKGTNAPRSDRSEMLMHYIQAVQNVDLQVCEALKSCFMLLWD